jgi:hypothetical protein
MKITIIINKEVLKIIILIKIRNKILTIFLQIILFKIIKN